jgi:hypothetical protein
MAADSQKSRTRPVNVPAPHSSTDKLRLGNISHAIRVSAHVVNSSHSHPMIELVHRHHQTAEKILDGVGNANDSRSALTAVAGLRAFRNYDVPSQVFHLSRAGNARGMVLSRRWRTVFRHVNDESHLGRYMENAGYLATLASGIIDSAPKIEAVLGSSDPASLKGMRLSAIAGTVAQRALLDFVPTGAHLIYQSLEGWCMIAGLAGGKAESAASEGIKTLQYADTLVHTSFRALTDTDNQSKAVWWLVDLATSRRRK